MAEVRGQAVKGSCLTAYASLSQQSEEEAKMLLVSILVRLSFHVFALQMPININVCTAAHTHLLKAALRPVRTFSIKFLCRLEETLY